MKISVTYLSSENLEKDWRKINLTNADYIHVDVMDGKFVKNKTWPFKRIKTIHKYTNKRLDVHLMVNKPHKFISDYASLNTEFITIHVENEKYIDKSLKLIESYGIKKGLSINPDTDLKMLEPYLDRIDLILVMSVVPGKGGQPFIDTTPKRIKELKNMLMEHGVNTLISVDGGVDEESAKKLKDVDILVSGSYVINSEDFQYSIYKLRNKK